MEKIRVARIDKDYLYDGKIITTTRVGMSWTRNPANTDKDLPTIKTRFRCLDDDEEVYYGGWLLNDDECRVQEVVLNWCRVDAGCTIIEVKKDGKWVREIG